jgi:outer membrane lipoprotein-sorting protein
MNRVVLRWLPAAVIPVLIAAGTLAAHAVTDVNLPTKTPEQVLALALASSDSVDAFSGTVEQSSQLGLPDLPTSGRAADSDVASAFEFLTGSHTARVYVDGPTKQRVQLMDPMAERGAVRNGSDVWLYDSSKATATQLSLPSASEARKDGSVNMPSQFAQKLLANMSPTTAVSLGDNVSIAGRSAYDLMISPRTTDTLVGSVSVAVDSETGFPLSVEVSARGAHDPAVSVAFSSLSFETPSSDLFTFSPQAGMTVTHRTVPAPTPSQWSSSNAKAPHPVVTGTGWASVIELPSGSVPAGVLDSPLLSQATTSFHGGRLLSTALVNVLLTNDGRIFAGSVPADALQAAAAG